MSSPATFVHLDLDQFFVSVERLHDPSLRGKPVCVGGADPSARGAVACASYEARQAGVHSGQALRRARALCPQAIFVAGSPQRYLELSRRVRQLLEERTPRVVPRSIDEFDIDLTGCERLLGSPFGVARELQATVQEETGLPCSLGVAGTPLVAKVAASEGKPQGLVEVPGGGEARFLAELPIRKLPGVGPYTEGRLHELGVATIGELAQLDPDLVEGALGARGRNLRARAEGGAARLAEARPGGPFLVGWGLQPGTGEKEPPSQERDAVPKSLSRARTFAEDQDDRRVLDQALVRLVENATSSLRVGRLRARSVELAVRYADLKVVSRRARLPKEAEEDRVLQVVRQLLAQLLQRRLRIRRLGVSFHGLALSYEQLELFVGPQARSRRSLGLALDRVRDRYGWEAVRFGSGLRE